MKNLILFFTAIIFISCSKAENKPVAATPVKEPDSIATQIGNIDKKDDWCLRDIEQAKDSIKQNRFTYYVYRNNPSFGYHKDLLKKLLAPYHINCERSWAGSCIPLIGVREDCYFEYMRKAVKDKFKPGFVDSLETVAIAKALKMLPDDHRSDFEDADKTIVYPGAKSIATQFADCNRDFLLGFKYPKGFKFSKGELWHADAGIMMYKDGHNGGSSSTIEFTDTINIKYKKYFETRIDRFISTTKWRPVYGAGVPLNCPLPINLYDRR